jgi:hypothetical protein
MPTPLAWYGHGDEDTSGRQEPFTYGSTPGREDYFFVTTH